VLIIDRQEHPWRPGAPFKLDSAANPQVGTQP
jgi:hypothetical protein